MSRGRRRLHLAVVGIAGLVLATGCAPAVRQEPAQLTTAEGKEFRLTRAVTVPLSTGYSTTLQAGSRWQLVGGVAQGQVYRTRDHVVTVEGSDIHEAYIVVRDGSLVGFYLPVKGTFSRVNPAVPLAAEWGG